MALIVCPECGEHVSQEAAVCPHCGTLSLIINRKVEDNIMKKLKGRIKNE